MRQIRILLLGILVILLASCNSAVSTLSQPTSQPGTATVSGIIQPADSSSYAGSTMRLAEIQWQGDEGAYVVNESVSPSALVQDDGSFAFMNVLPADYVLVMMKPLQEYKPVTEPDGKLKMLKVEADTPLDLGSFNFDY